MDGIEIIPYAPQYEEEVKDLLSELQAALVACDPEGVQVMKKRYREEYLGYVLQLVRQNSGAAFLALRAGEAIGFAAGYIETKDEEDLLTNRCPKRGVVSELVVSSPLRRGRIGRVLLSKLEDFFSENGCEFIAIDVFAPNDTARKFYETLGYRPRNIEYYRRIGESPNRE